MKIDGVDKNIEESQGAFKNEFEQHLQKEAEKASKKQVLDTTLDEEMQVSTTKVFTRIELLSFLK